MYNFKLIKEEVNRLDEVTREEVRADFERMFPEETPEQIEARVADYMDYTPEDYTRRGVEFGKPGYGEFPPKPEKYGLKQGFKDVMKQAFSMEEEELQEMDRSGEDETFNDPEGAADRYRNRKKGKEMAQQGQDPTPRKMPAGAKSTMGRFPNLQETLKRIAKAKNITLKSSGKKIK